MSGFLSFPRGGIETAGLLLGTVDQETIHVVECVEIACEHAAGPTLLLSDSDQARLARLLSEKSNGSEPGKLEALGWFVSHGRRPFVISETDREIFDRFFTKPHSVIVLVRPHANGAADFAWFARSHDGSFDSDHPAWESSLPAYIPTPASAAAPSQALVVPVPRVRALERNRPEPPTITPVFPARRVPFKNYVIAALFCAVLLGSIAAWRWRTPSTTAPWLRVSEVGSQLRIDWDPASTGIRETQSGSLEIKDLLGRTVQIPLDATALRAGTALYSNPSDAVEIRLKLQQPGGRPLQSMIYYVSAKPARQTQPATPQPQVEPSITAPAVPERVLVRDIAPQPEPPKKTLEKPVQASKERPTDSADRIAAKRFQPPPVRSRRVSSAELQLPLPSAVAPVTAPPAPQTLPGLTPNAIIVPPPAIAAKPRPAPRQSFGRLIWTGRLNRNEIVRLTNHGASAGWLNQSLPGFPIKVNVRSADLLDGAIVVYVASQDALRTAEAPNKENGWNVTVYKWEPAHAHDVTLIETPNSANNWNQISVKGLNRVSMLVIDWQSM